MRVGKQIGFTIVELLVVVVVLLVLTAITSAIYGNVQIQARDTKNADSADKMADAIKLFVADNGHFPRGGWGSGSAIGTAQECANGQGGWAGTGYLCDIEDTLVASGYLPAGFVSKMSPNPLPAYSATTDGSYAMMVYAESITGTPPVHKSMVMYSMEDPSAADTAHFNAELTKCLGSVPGSYAPRDTYGMKNGICVITQTF